MVERLRAGLRTPAGRARCVAPTGLFAETLEDARALLAETSVARALLDAEEAAPLGGVEDVGATLKRAERGGRLAPADLLDLASALDAVHATARFLARHGERAPRLAQRAASLGDHRSLAEAIVEAIDPEGQLRDDASPLLAEAREASRRLAAEITRRLERSLHDPELGSYLSDRFVTLRNDRFVLPVRADARGSVRGIVHDASASGTTLFVEPDWIVDPNNRLKEAELAVAREGARILRELSEDVGAEAAAIRASLARLGEIDLAFARGALSREFDAVEPRLAEMAGFELPQLRHPLLPGDRAVPNDVRLGSGWSVLVLSGPNAGGKTVAMKAVALAALCARAGLHVAAGPGARVEFVDGVLADIGDAQSLRESLSTFSAHMANLARIVAGATSRSLVVLDEIGDGTDPGEGAALAQAVLEALADSGARVIATTHYNLLKELAAADPRFENGCFEFDEDTMAPTYRLRLGAPGASSAAAVAARMGMPSPVLERANALLDREDRRLERMLARLAENRLALERERAEAERVRAETEAERREVRRKLEQLQQRRDRLLGELRADLESAFRGAHAEVAAVVRGLQRGATARDAARARERLLAVQSRARQQVERMAPEPEPVEPIDWRAVRPGDAVRVRGGGEAVLLALPDRHGRVAVRAGGARLRVPAERIAPAGATAGRPRVPGAPHVRVDATLADATADAGRCDLRGLRVEEALAKVATALDRAALAGRRRLVCVHGLGTGRLRDAVRAYLAESAYVTSYAPGDLESGGDGVTRVELGD